MEREQATKFIYDLLRALLAKKGSDLFITAGFPPAMKIDNKMTPVSQTPLTNQHTSMLVRSIMNDKQAAEFEASKECNFAINPAGIGRFRVNCFVQQGQVGAVLRVITTTIPNFEDLKLPPVLKDVAMTKRGLVLFVGGTGSGKSTSLAAMIGYRNENSYGHIITIEDPVEYVHPHLNCMITQREVGVDTDSWEAALKNTLRQAPDVILIGEIHGIKEIMKKSRELGMQTFDQALFDLFEAGRIGYEDALRFADSTNEVRLNIKLHGKDSKDKDLTKGIEHLDIV